MHEHLPIFQEHVADSSEVEEHPSNAAMVIYKGSIKSWVFSCIIFGQINKLQRGSDRTQAHLTEHSSPRLPGTMPPGVLGLRRQNRT